jgi:O-antigen/teichoic acid export membrane protein
LTTRARSLYRKYQSSLVLRSGMWYLAGKFLFKGITFASVAVFTRLLLPAEYGTTAIFFTWTSIFYVISTLYVEAAVLRAKFDYEGDEYRDFLSSVTLFGVALPFAAVAVFALLPETVSLDWFGLSKPLTILALLYAPAIITLNITLRQWEASSNYKPNVYVTIGVEAGEILLSVLLILIPPLLIAGYPPYMGRIWGYMIANGGVGLFLLARMFLRGRLRLRREHIAYALMLSVPLIPHALANMALSQFDRIMIDQYTGRAEAGIYSFAYQIGSLVFVVWTATNTAWAPWFYARMKDESYAIIRHRVRQYMLGFAGMTAALILGSVVFVPLLGTDAYRGAARITPVIMASGFFVFLYSLYVNVEFHERKTWYIAAGTVAAAVINIVLNLIFIPQYGYLAAGWTTLAAYACLFFIHAAVVRLVLKTPDVNRFPLAVALGALLTALAAGLYLAG